MTIFEVWSDEECAPDLGVRFVCFAATYEKAAERYVQEPISESWVFSEYLVAVRDTESSQPPRTFNVRPQLVFSVIVNNRSENLDELGFEKE